MTYAHEAVLRDGGSLIVRSIRDDDGLHGFRGAPPADRQALARIVARIAALADAVPELAELDLNPVLVRGPGEGAVVVDARMRLVRGGRS